MTTKTAGASRTSIPLIISEADFQTLVIEYAQYRGWMVVHYRPAVAGPQSRRYLTALQGHKGAPDLILARDGRVLLVELKTQTGRATPEQRAWLAAAGEHGRLWKPSQWDDEIVPTLR